MRSLPLALLAGSLVALAGCAMPFGASNVGSASVGGYFPAAKDAMWVYDYTSISAPEATPSKMVYPIVVSNVSKTGDIVVIASNGAGNVFPAKITKDKAYMSLSPDGEAIPLPLKKDATWTFKAGTASIEVKAADEPEVTVPAGKFKSLHLIYTNKDLNKVYQEKWLVDGVGLVKMVMNGSSTSSVELSSFHL